MEETIFKIVIDSFQVHQAKSLKGTAEFIPDFCYFFLRCGYFHDFAQFLFSPDIFAFLDALTLFQSYSNISPSIFMPGSHIGLNISDYCPDRHLAV